MRASAPGLLSRRLRREPVSDERLVARVRAGDARAFEEIYDRYGHPIHSFCRHMLGQAEDADDAVQHTFLAAYRAIHSGGQAIDLKPWLFAIARNRCISLLRTRRRDPSLVGEPPEEATEGLSAAVERRESLRDLLRDIGSLPDDQRAALILTQLGTLRHEEVARVLEVPTEKVKALVFQARSALVSTRIARETDCYDIREQLATLTGAALRRGTLRRHLLACSGCRDYQLALKRQRAAIVVLLPVVAHSALRGKVLGEIGGGAGAGSGAGGALGGLAAKGAQLKVGLAITLAATGAGVVGLTRGVRLALGEPPSSNASKLAVHGVTTQAADRRAISLPRTAVRTGDRGGRGSAGAGHVPATTQRDALRTTGPVPANEHVSSPGQRTGPVGGPTGSASKGATPPGLAKQGGVPPGLAKKGRTPPGLAKKGGMPPGLAKKGGSLRGRVRKNGAAPAHPKPGASPPGQQKKNPPAATSPGTSPAPAATGNGNPGGPSSGNGAGAGSGSRNGNGGGKGKGSPGGDGNGNGNGHGGG